MYNISNIFDNLPSSYLEGKCMVLLYLKITDQTLKNFGISLVTSSPCGIVSSIK